MSGDFPYNGDFPLSTADQVALEAGKPLAALTVWCRRHKCNAVPREVESEWAPLRVQITV